MIHFLGHPCIVSIIYCYCCVFLQKVHFVETASEEEPGDEAGSTSADYYIWSGTGTDEDSDWQSQGDPGDSESTDDTEVEEDLSSETTQRDIRCDWM